MTQPANDNGNDDLDPWDFYFRPAVLVTADEPARIVVVAYQLEEQRAWKRHMPMRHRLHVRLRSMSRRWHKQRRRHAA